MRLRYPLAGVLLSIVAVLAIVPIAQAQDDPYGDGLTCGDLRGWFREHFPRETELRDAILDRIEPCAVDDWLNHGMVFLAMNEVDGDDAGALAAMGKVFFESRNGHHVTSGQMDGWINAWLAFRAEQAAVIEKAAEDAENAVAEAEAAAAAAAEAAEAAASIAAAERPPWPEPTRTGETFQSQQLMCVGPYINIWGRTSCGSKTYDTSADPVTCHIMSDGHVECEQ